MDWFETLTGFKEGTYAWTQQRLAVEGDRLRSLVNGRSYAIGHLDIVSLATLRQRVAQGDGAMGRLKVTAIGGDVGDMHSQASLRGALFQVASQFNLLEMIGPSMTPEHGVTRYHSDLTQGPACAIAAGAATIFRNYFVPLQGGIGQTADRQVDCLAPLGQALAARSRRPVEALWAMQNGYALCGGSSLRAIADCLGQSDETDLDRLRGLLQIGLHSDVEVTDHHTHPGPLVSQAFCSALPVAYGAHPVASWAGFARLVLEAAYEATLCAAVLNARRGASNIVLLTRLGGGAFGNADAWIDAAMIRALDLMRDMALDVRLVSFGEPPQSMRAIEQRFA